MLVKELRQGFRSKVFLFSFLGLQIAMIMLAIVGLNSTGGALQAVTIFFWLIIGFPVLITMPFSGLNSISAEKKENTLEPIFLSRLSARRIVLGKWLAIIAQTTLIASAVLPYMVLRYFFGGINLVEELIALGCLLIGSAVMTSITVALSPNTGRIGRALIPVGIVFFIQFFGMFSARAMFGGPTLFAGPHGGFGALTAMLLATLLLALLFLFCMLEIGAQKIAPSAENHSTPKRLAAFGAVIICCLYSLIWPGAAALWTMAAFIIIPIVIGAVCEPVREVMSVYRPFVRWGFPGRIFGRVFYPGWPSGVFFVLILLALIFLVPHGPFSSILASFIGSLGPHPVTGSFVWAGTVIIGTIGAIFLPVALLRLLPARGRPPVTPFILFQTASVMLALLAHSLADPSPSGFETVLAMIPSCGLVFAAMNSSSPELAMPVSLGGATVLTLFSFLILFVKMIPGWKKIRALETAAQSSPSQNVIAPSEPA